MCVYSPAPSHPTPSFKKWQVCNLCLLLNRTMRKLGNFKVQPQRNKNSHGRQIPSACIVHTLTFAMPRSTALSLVMEILILCHRRISCTHIKKHVSSAKMFFEVQKISTNFAHLELDLSSRFVWRKNS